MHRPNTAAIATFAIATLAFLLSYSKLSDLADRAGYSGPMSMIYPIIIDGLAVVATYGVLKLQDTRYAWWMLGSATTVSVTAAVASSVLAPGPLPGAAAALVSVVPALCLLAAPHLAVQLMRHQDATPNTEPVADATPKVAPGPDNDPDVAPDPEDCDVLTLVEVPEDRRAKALRLVSVDGMSMRAAAREVGVSDTTVRRWLRDSEAETTKAA